MFRSLPALVSLLLLAGGASASAVQPQDSGQDEVLRLRDGRLIVGEILDHDLDGLEVSSARTGGRFHLGWGDLFPGEDERVKRALGYRVNAVQPMVSADRLLFKDGSQRVGRILRRDERVIELRSLQTTVVVPRQRLAAPPDQVTVPASQILTPEQFYAERLPEVDANDALAQYEFARELQSVFALEQAMQHLTRAGELAQQNGDTALQRRVEGALSELALTIANRSQAEMLEEVRSLIHRERFVQALATLDAFEEQYPDSPLAGDARDLRDRFEKSRVDAMENYLTRNWFNAVVAILKRKALDKDAKVDAVVGWLESELPQLVRAEMGASLQDYKENLDLGELDGLWAARFSHSPNRFQASFGDGSWILGEEKARKGLEAEEKEEEDGKTQAEKEFEERVSRYLDSLNRARNRGNASAEDSPEEWWRNATTTERFQFMLAYYGEFSGDYEVTSVRFDRCPICAGTGVITVVEMGAQGAKDRKHRCPRCKGVGIRRAITFR